MFHHIGKVWSKRAHLLYFMALFGFIDGENLILARSFFSKGAEHRNICSPVCSEAEGGGNRHRKFLGVHSIVPQKSFWYCTASPILIDIAILSKIFDAAQVAQFFSKHQNVCLRKVSMQPFSTNISVLCTFPITINCHFFSIWSLFKRCITQKFRRCWGKTLKVFKTFKVCG